MSLRRLFAVWHARNLEFLRDRSTLIFNFLFPLALVIAFALIFGGQPRPLFKVDVIAPPGATLDAGLHPFLGTRYVEFVASSPVPSRRRSARSSGTRWTSCWTCAQRRATGSTRTRRKATSPRSSCSSPRPAARRASR